MKIRCLCVALVYFGSPMAFSAEAGIGQDNNEADGYESEESVGINGIWDDLLDWFESETDQ